MCYYNPNELDTVDSIVRDVIIGRGNGEDPTNLSIRIYNNLRDGQKMTTEFSDLKSLVYEFYDNVE
jgi:hypothetical protein